MRANSDSASPAQRISQQITAALLAGSALVGVASVATIAAMTPTLADGGRGGNGNGVISSGAPGGAGLNGSPGGDFNSAGANGGAGGGGSGGGTGGAGFDGLNPVPGGTGGNPGHPDGFDGTSSAAGSGGGGGFNGATTFGGNITGGNGGAGGASSVASYGAGGGGAGGYGVVITTGGSFSNSGLVSGGGGGAGGAATAGNSNGGVGGDGGVGAQFTASGVTLTNSGTISGGIGGASGDGPGVPGQTADGVASFSGLTIVNTSSGTIAGGTSAVRADTGNLNFTNAGNISGGVYSVNAVAGAVSGVNSGVLSGWVQGETGVTLTNTETGTISGHFYGVNSNLGVADVTNAGTITGMTGVQTSSGGVVKLVNSGTISATHNFGVVSGDATITNTASGVISSALFGVFALNTLSLNNAGTITGGTYAASAGVVDITNTGLVSGSTAVIANADGSTVFNAGTLTGTGGTAIQFTGSSNTLTLASGSVITGIVQSDTGGNTFQLGGAGAGTFDISALDDTAQYRNFGTFNKVGSSTWTVTGTSTFAGDVNVNAGTLVADGNLSSASAMFVNPGGTLSGTGTVPFTLLGNDATLAPGPLTGTGTLTINDRATFCDCSIYTVKISATGNDMARVAAGGLGTGDAFLDGQVRASSPTGAYRFNSPYTILTTQGGLNGTTFSSLATPTGTSGVLSYTGNDVLLTLTSGLAQLSGLNINQRAVATALDTAFNAGSGIGAMGAIFNGNVPLNLTQASGEPATGSQQATFDAMNIFMGVLTDPFIASRGDPVGGGGNPNAFADEAQAYASGWKGRSKRERDAYAAVYTKAPPLAPTFEQRWSVWAAGFGGSQRTDGNTVVGSNDTRSSIYGVAAGADYRFSPNTIGGFALAGGGTNFSVNGLGTGRSDLFQAGGFIRHTIGAAYLTGALAYGWQDITTERTVTVAGADRLRAQLNANAWSGRAEAGYRFVTPWIGGVGITPYAAGQFTTFQLPGYAETVISGANTFALSYAAKDVTASRSELGLRSDKSFAMQDGIFSLRGRAAWAHNFNTERSIGATFQTLPGASFVVNGAAQARNAALATASAEMKWLNGWSAAATFEGEFSDVTRSYAGKGVVRYAW